jgi:hypothetical protein
LPRFATQKIHTTASIDEEGHPGVDRDCVGTATRYLLQGFNTPPLNSGVRHYGRALQRNEE